MNIFRSCILSAFAVSAAVVLSACGNLPAAQDGFEPLQGADAVRMLQSHRWRLDTATEASGKRIDALFPASSRGVMLAFDRTMVFIDGGCNSMRGSYRFDTDGRLVVGRLAATMKACEPALMQADAALSKLLAQPLRAHVVKGTAPKLRLATASNESLLLAGELTHEARYGPSTRMFLEVAARKVPCKPPASPESRCLQVRERFFDAQGLQAGAPGEWQVFADAIEGYTHREGERNVLRIKRFQRPAPAGSAPFVYVLDLVVETEIVRP